MTIIEIIVFSIISTAVLSRLGYHIVYCKQASIAHLLSNPHHLLVVAAAKNEK